MIDDRIAGLLGDRGEHLGQRQVVALERDQRRLGRGRACACSSFCCTPRDAQGHFGRRLLADRGQQRQHGGAQLQQLALGLVARGQLAGVELSDQARPRRSARPARRPRVGGRGQQAVRSTAVDANHAIASIRCQRPGPRALDGCRRLFDFRPSGPDRCQRSARCCSVSASYAIWPSNLPIAADRRASEQGCRRKLGQRRWPRFAALSVSYEPRLAVEVACIRAAAQALAGTPRPATVDPFTFPRADTP